MCADEQEFCGSIAFDAPLDAEPAACDTAVLHGPWCCNAKPQEGRVDLPERENTPYRAKVRKLNYRQLPRVRRWNKG